VKILNFDYEKKPDDVSSRELLIIHSNDESVEGIDLSILNEKEKEDLLKIQKEYEDNIYSYMKAYRKFLFERIVESTIVEEKR
jgi:hypothetical protein